MLGEATDANGRAARAARLRGLYAVTPDLDDTTALTAMVSAAIDGGATAVQYRNKTAPKELRRTQAYALAVLCRSRDTLYIVNDDPQLAALVNADGVHLGEDDIDIAAARDIVGPTALIGVSCYDDLSRARTLADQGVDYLAFGSLFASSVKPNARRASLELLSAARSLGVPIVGIGGIDENNAAEVIDAGADAVAVINAVFGVDDVESAAERIARACET
ncbi:MAG TPA: thiamine phosphate synthase [Casimicrobiaceae bacterium]|nr:thiamine phosphate synthase [Casimicrobiaceae bacterium]